jgi:hypothetical protein
MRVRTQDANGDMLFGLSTADFLVNSSACVRQLVLTTLRLMQGEWFLDVTAGVPYATEVIGTGTKSLYDLVIRQAILGVPGVTELINYSSQFTPQTRQLVIPPSVLIQTQYSQEPIPLGPVTI